MTGRVAFVTGASRGIGGGTAIELARAGNRVAICYSSDAGGAASTVKVIEAEGGEAFAVQADVADTDAVDAAFTAIEDHFGPVEILVNNAGMRKDGLIARMSDDQWDSVLRTNLTGAFHTIRRAAPKMMRGRFGRIVNVSSVSGHYGLPGQANYSAAKAGLLGLSRATARELAPRQVTCNVVAPGPVRTAMTADLPDEWQQRLEEAVPLGRAGTVEECAAVITFLCSDLAGYITGALVPVDGGLGMGH